MTYYTVKPNYRFTMPGGGGRVRGIGGVEKKIKGFIFSA